MACLPKLMEYFLKLMEIFSKLMAYFLKLAVHLRFGYKDTTSALRFTNTSRIIFFLCIFFVCDGTKCGHLVMVILVKIENRLSNLHQ